MLHFLGKGHHIYAIGDHQDVVSLWISLLALYDDYELLQLVTHVDNATKLVVVFGKPAPFIPAV